jgi:hypothetical protein
VTIWTLEDPRDAQFAEAGCRGAWSDGLYCPECRGSTEERIQPLILEWRAGSDRIGDFTCTGVCSGFAVSEQAGKALQRYFKGFELGPVKMIQGTKLKKPKRVTKRTKPRVWLPYAGPMLYELWVTTWVHMDRERTSAKLVRCCNRCGNERYELSGAESHTSRWNVRTMALDHFHTARVPGQGLYVRSGDLADADIFGVREFSGWIFCTDRVKKFVEEQQFTNVTFWEHGEVV